jgi:DNA helicase HerA-like ATPase
MAFLFQPGDWLPDIEGKIKQDLDYLLEDWIGGDQPISILDLSGIPTSVLNDLIGALLRILYDAIFWARNLPDGGRLRPLLMVLEEAHAYLAKENSNSAAAAVRRIAKEGRKYGVGMMIVSQRPSEIDSTILSQCGTIFAMRLANDTDRGHVTGAASDNLKGLFEMLPILRTGEAIIVGEAVSLPVRTLITPPPPEKRPDSSDPNVVVRKSNEGYGDAGSWNQPRDPKDYAAMIRQWRKQSPHYKHNKSEKLETSEKFTDEIGDKDEHD